MKNYSSSTPKTRLIKLLDEAKVEIEAKEKRISHLSEQLNMSHKENETFREAITNQGQDMSRLRGAYDVLMGEHVRVLKTQMRKAGIAWEDIDRIIGEYRDRGSVDGRFLKNLGL